MDSVLLSSLSNLSNAQKLALKKGGILTVSELFLSTPADIARKCKLAPLELQGIVDSVCKENSSRPRLLEDIKKDRDQKFTTGDAHLDEALGGGIRTGMVWEVAGESAAGKTQFALQLSLLVQLPPKLGGLSGSACYLTTSSTLPTSRLVQLADAHPLLSPTLCGLSGIQTLSTDTIPKLLFVLSDSLPRLLRANANNPGHKPVKLLVIDALAELFHSSNRTSTATLVERSRNISEISMFLHSLASKYRMAILVLNEVVDPFDYGPNQDTGDGDLLYRDQTRWFSRTDSLPGESMKEASLGLVWANQVNVRLMFSRTGRRRYLHDVAGQAKKHRRIRTPRQDLQNSSPDPQISIDDQTLIRKLNVIFSSLSPPTSLDFIITVEGLSVIPQTFTNTAKAKQPPFSIHRPAVTSALLPPESSQVSPLDVGCLHDSFDITGGAIDLEPIGDDDEWEAFWKEDELDSLVVESGSTG